jgi:NitT/TauT family transport system substrate-binding protein
MMRIYEKLRCVFLVAAVVVGAPGLAAAQALEHIKITIPSPTIVFYPLYYAQEKGLFAKEGLDAEIIVTNGDGPDVDAVISGSAQFAVTTPNRLFTSFEQGRPLKAIMMLARRMAIDCAMNKEVADRLGITTASPLNDKLRAMKGLTVAGSRAGSFTYVLLQIYARRVGLVPQRDLQIIGIGGSSAMLPALENGKIAVGCTGSPFVELAAMRGKAIRMTDNMTGGDPAYDDFLYQTVYANPDLLAKHPDIARRFVRALHASVNAILDTPSADHMPALRARYGGPPDQVIRESFENTKKIFSRDGRITPGSVQKAGAFMIESGVVKTAASFDQIATNAYLPQP